MGVGAAFVAGVVVVAAVGVDLPGVVSARIDLKADGKVPGIDAATFDDYAKKAKDACLVSRALAGVNEITLSSKLAS